MNILGISAFYHDAAAALVVDGEVVAAVQQERFSRVKNDASLPLDAMRSCLEAGGVADDGVDVVVYYEKPLASFVRVVKTFAAAGPAGFRAFPRAMDQMLRTKLWASYEIERGLASLGYARPGRTLFAEHHVSHAAAAFYPSPFETACILTFDGVGEWATSSIGTGRGRRIDLVQEMRFPHSIGLLYSAFTRSAGFSVNSGEYKLMGLAPYGEPTLRDAILEHVIDLRDDGSFTADLSYFGYAAGRQMTTRRFDELVGGPPRGPDEPIEQRHCDLAASIQSVVEEIVLRVARHGHELTGDPRVVLGGGVALNCVANGRLLREGPFDEVWVPPNPGDAGSALGCALWAWHDVLGNERDLGARRLPPEVSALGPSFDGAAIAAELEAAGRPFTRLADDAERADRVAGLLADGKTIGVVHGPLEFGPRALGHRSILADPRTAEVARSINARTKKRESFRPFAPAVLADRADEWFDVAGSSPFMSFTAPVRGAEVDEARARRDDDLVERLAHVRSPLPAVTHIDGSARLQTVTPQASPELHRLLTAFDARTGCPVLLNTSFNVRGEPIVATPDDAYRCFMTTELDYLLLEDCLLAQADQPPWPDD